MSSRLKHRVMVVLAIRANVCLPLLGFSRVDTLVERPRFLGRFPVGTGHRFLHPPGWSRAPLPSISLWSIERRLPAWADLFSTLRSRRLCVSASPMLGTLHRSEQCPHDCLPPGPDLSRPRFVGRVQWTLVTMAAPHGGQPSASVRTEGRRCISKEWQLLGRLRCYAQTFSTTIPT